MVQPEDERYQAIIDGLVSRHLGWTPVLSDRAESGKRRAWVVDGLRYNNLKALRALHDKGVQL